MPEPPTTTAADAADAGGYLPAMRFRVLTPAFDAVVRMAMREKKFRPALIAQVDAQPGQRVLDIGAGTGTLALLAKQAQRKADITALDADPDILELARRKAAQRGLEVQFDLGLSTDLPYADGSFDKVMSTLFFHHLSDPDKRTTLAEVTRVLRPGGELHIGDYTRAADPLQLLLSGPVRLFDGLERTRTNYSGRLPHFLADAGFRDVHEGSRLRTVFGTLGFVSAQRGD